MFKFSHISFLPPVADSKGTAKLYSALAVNFKQPWDNIRGGMDG